MFSLQRRKELEKVTRGYSNHRRIQVLEYLAVCDRQSVEDISKALRVNYKTISEHARRLHLAGLVSKKSQGASVLHSLTNRGKVILKFLRTLE